MINEAEFKALCEELRAEVPNILKRRPPHMNEESVLLQELYVRLCQRLGIDPAVGTGSLDGFPEDALSAIFEINEIMRQHASPSFNHSRIVKEFLHESLRGIAETT